MIDTLVFAVLALAVGVVSIYGRSPRVRAGAFVGLVAGLLALWFLSLGLPRPAYFRVPNGTVLGYRLDEPHWIYLWLVPDGSSEPLALQIPWHPSVAGNLVDADRHRANAGDRLQMRNPSGETGLRDKPVFYVSHVEALPPKAPAR